MRRDDWVRSASGTCRSTSASVLDPTSTVVGTWGIGYAGLPHDSASGRSGTQQNADTNTNCDADDSENQARGDYASSRLLRRICSFGSGERVGDCSAIVHGLVHLIRLGDVLFCS